MVVSHDKERERRQKVGLFRYQLICLALDTGLSTKARGKVVREIAAREHTDPFGTSVRYSRDTLDRWIRRYRADGFEALVPATRQASVRTDAAVLEMAAALKRENPARTAAQVARILRASSGWSPSESTLLRHFHRLELIGPAAGDTVPVFGRFEAENPNDRWTGDVLHGPKIGGRKSYLFAFLDDHSRLITGYRFGFSEDTVRLGVALEPALAARGVPASVYVDNGSAFVDAWLLRACAKLGVRLVHSTPHRPQGRGKIERFFRTVREQFLVEIVDTTAEELAQTGLDHRSALLELNRLFTGWVETEYHRAPHSETGQSPLDRWEAGWARCGRTAAMPTAADLTEAFLWSEYRTVTKTATVSLHGNTYQVDAALVGRKVELVFSPFDMETIDVRYNDASHGRAVPHTITRHVHPKARPEIPEPPTPTATGIDYLHLVAETHHDHVRRDHRIGYDALFGAGTDTSSDAGTDAQIDGQIDGQLSIDDIVGSGTERAEGSA
ncbi:DDE-type integrase/transposase/recombinase [Gordonia sp. ABSL11-1]|uniref:DDE-type integrase/transposase/recombinase n=1 Tax=Gordonia sp. ABSL11-1 TaxID=3053924 RepID=UPI002573B2D4|nr:DDE-type integrase/transposase/recombinase [Gordonia sp. ABSL11-1]MDL9949032.1 DDE-type integrase/transposase/recombinase [Gordonia sp. ABSL11-1]